MSQDIRGRLSEPHDAKLAQSIADAVRRMPTKTMLWELAEELFGVKRGRRRDQYAGEIDRMCERNPHCFQFVADPTDGIDRVTLRPTEVQARVADMRHLPTVGDKNRKSLLVVPRERPGQRRMKWSFPFEKVAG